MDISEIAHIVKKKPQGKKAEENTKKQLRQMLYGYRHNDPKAIKRSAEKKVDLTLEDDYSSCSESNLPINMNMERFTSQESSSEPDIMLNEEHNKTVTEIYPTNEDSPTCNTTTDDTRSSDADDASISEFNDEMMSLSEESDSEQNNYQNQSDTEYTSSDILNVNSADSGQFDANGELAAKILSRLEKRPKERLFMPRKKIKLSHLKNLVNNWSIEDVEHIPIPNTDVTDTFCQTNPEDFVNDNQEKIDTKPTSEEAGEKPEHQLPPSPPSEPYVLYQAKKFKDERLSKVMRGYNFSTVAHQPPDLVIVPEPVNCLFPAELQNHEELNSEYSDEDEEGEEPAPVPAPPVLPAPEQVDEEIPPQEEFEPIDFDEDIEDVRSNDGVADSQGDVQVKEIDSRDPLTLYYTNDTCIVVMKHPAKLFIHGKLIAHLLGGAANIHGYSLKQEPCKIYAPNYNHAQYIETIENENSYYGLFGKLTSTGLSVAQTEDIVTSIGEYDVILHLQPLKSNRMEFVENNFTVADLFSKPSKHISELLKQASEMLGCSLYMEKPTRCFIEKNDWTHVARFCNEPNSRGIICGGKNTGKSTFLRYYVNRCLANGPVLVIDLDPGQSEFTVAGNISATVVKEPLLGPNFTHLKTPDLMLNIGMVSVMDNLRRYTTAISDLFAHCYAAEQYKQMPWIINTMGMCNKVGLKLTTLIILLAKPMFVMQLDSKNSKKRYECYLNAHAIKNIYDNYKENDDPLFKNIYASSEDFDFNLYLSHEDLDSDGKRTNFALAARDERYLSFLAYFGGVVEDKKSSSLLAVIPYEVEIGALKIASNVKFNSEAEHKVLNGKIVALCREPPEERKSRLLILQDKPMICHGHALIRAIDPDLGSFFMVTPEPVDRICLAETMLYTDWVPELRVEVSLPDQTTVPYRTGTLQHQRQLMFTAKRRFNPIQYLKASRTT